MSKKKIIWGALFAVNFIYIALTFSVLRKDGVEDPSNMAGLFLGMGVFFLILSFFLEKLLQKSDTSPEQLTSAIVGMAVNESCALFGIVTVVLTGNELYAGILFALSIAGFIFRFPNQEIVKTKLDV